MLTGNDRSYPATSNCVTYSTISSGCYSALLFNPTPLVEPHPPLGLASQYFWVLHGTVHASTSGEFPLTPFRWRRHCQLRRHRRPHYPLGRF